MNYSFAAIVKTGTSSQVHEAVGARACPVKNLKCQNRPVLALCNLLLAASFLVSRGVSTAICGIMRRC